MRLNGVTRSQLSMMRSNTGAVLDRTADDGQHLGRRPGAASASRVSLNRRGFSIAITAWLAKGLEQAISSSVNGRMSECNADRAVDLCRRRHRRGEHREALRPSWPTRRRRLGGTPSPWARSGSGPAGEQPAEAGAGPRNTERSASRISPNPARQWISRRRPPPIARSAPGNRRKTLSQIRSNTGWVSASELLTTRSTSALAVCRSSA